MVDIAATDVRSIEGKQLAVSVVMAGGTRAKMDIVGTDGASQLPRYVAPRHGTPGMLQVSCPPRVFRNIDRMATEPILAETVEGGSRYHFFVHSAEKVVLVRTGMVLASCAV